MGDFIEINYCNIPITFVQKQIIEMCLAAETAKKVCIVFQQKNLV